MKYSLTALVILVVITSCMTKQKLAPLDPEDEFTRATAFFQQGKFTDAIQAFERILFYHPTSEFVDDAQYWLGRSYYEQKDYDQAIVEFDYLIRNFTTSRFIEETYLFKAKAYLMKAPGYEKDPTELENAINMFNTYLTRFPNSEHTEEIRTMILEARNTLARKELENGKLYAKLSEPDAALVYFNYIINTYPETVHCAEAKYFAAEAYEEKKEYAKALALYTELQDEDIWKDKVLPRIERLQPFIKDLPESPGEHKEDGSIDQM
jgi:outer membrane protein assembly factor BamD